MSLLLPRGTGCLPDHDHVREFAPRMIPRMGAEASVRSLDEFAPTILDQGPAQSCTGFALAYAFAISMRAHGHAGWPMPAPMWLYLVGRRWEWHEARPEDRPPLADGGARFHDLLQGAKTLGVAPLEAWPYDAREAVSEAPPVAYAQAFRLAGLDYAFLDPGPGRIALAAQAHHDGWCTVFGGPVGEDYARSDGKEPYKPPAVAIGGHGVAVSSIDPRDGRGRGPGSYGEQLGDGGWFTYSAEWLESAPDAWAVRPRIEVTP